LLEISQGKAKETGGEEKINQRLHNGYYSAQSDDESSDTDKVPVWKFVHDVPVYNRTGAQKRLMNLK